MNIIRKNIIVIWFLSGALADAGLGPDLTTYHQRVKPILKKYCLDCHGPDKAKAKIRFDTLNPDILEGEDQEVWLDALEVFKLGEMPPEDELQPSETERDVMTLWLDGELKKAKLAGRDDPKSHLRRLTKYELKYSLEDLFGLPADKFLESIPEESPSLRTGLHNNANSLQVSSQYIDSYLNVILNYIGAIKAMVEMDSVHTVLDAKKYEQLKKDKFEKKFLKTLKKVGNDLIVEPGSFIDLSIPQLSLLPFEISIEAKTERETTLEFYVGYRYSKNYRNENLQLIGEGIHQGKTEFEKYKLRFDPLVAEMSIDLELDNPYFIKVVHNGTSPLNINSIEFVGNLNDEFITSIKGKEKPFEIRMRLQEFMRLAYRREVSSIELNDMIHRFQSYRKEVSPILALLSVYEDVLSSPKFLYFGLSNKTKQHSIAERLSYFLWCSLPDLKLMDQAREGSLNDPVIVGQQIQRMLQDKKSKRFVEHFSTQWLHTEKLFNIAVDDQYYKKFSDEMKLLMHQETIESLKDVLINGSSALNLISSDHVFVNEPLAEFYEISGVKGKAFQKVRLVPQHPRGGLVTQGTFLVGNSDGINSHAILRGVWLTEVLLNDPPPSAPNNVPPLDDSIPGFEKMTLNQKMFAHRNHDACRNCHNKIDPYGIPLENFDASGAWRNRVTVLTKDHERSKKKNKAIFEKTFIPVESKSTLAGKKEIDGVLDLKQYLILERKEDFAKGLVEKLLAYALSRDVTFYDETVVEELYLHLSSRSFSVPNLIQQIVMLPEFQGGGLK